MTSPEQQLIQLEKDWYKAILECDLTALGQILADDYTNTDAEGTICTKVRDLANFKSGRYVAKSLKCQGMKVRVYGKAAVVTGRDTVGAQFMGADVSGPYRWTDTWVKRAGRWRCVASHGSRIAPKITRKPAAQS